MITLVVCIMYRGDNLRIYICEYIQVSMSISGHGTGGLERTFYFPAIPMRQQNLSHKGREDL